MLSSYIRFPLDTTKIGSEAPSKTEHYAIDLPSEESNTTASILRNKCTSPYRSEEPWFQYICVGEKPPYLTSRRRNFYLKNLFGSFQVEWKVAYQLTSQLTGDLPSSTKNQEHRFSLAIKPALWLKRLFSYILHIKLVTSRREGLMYNLRICCLIPDDSLIFRYSKEGNLPGLRYLLSQNQASVTDVNSYGQTALYVS